MHLQAGQRNACRDFTGEVVALGQAVTDLTHGQRVWGFLTDVPSRVGAAAEYITVKATTVSLAPGKADLAEAARR